MTKQKQYYARKMEKLKADPVALAEYKANQAAKAKARREAIKADPEKLARARESHRAAVARWRSKNLDKYHGTRKEEVARWRKENPDLYREQHLKRTYGISLADYTAMFEAQGNCCAGCGTDTPGGKGDWHVDHCHTNGNVRGILCRACNTALGLVKDQPATLKKLAEYLERT